MQAPLPKTIFVGWGLSVVSYYRAFLPAVVLGTPYAAWLGDDDAQELVLIGGPGDSPPSFDDLYDYDVVILQQPRGTRWMRIIQDLQAAGVCVLYEIDDYVQSARKDKRHELTDVYDAKFTGQMELAMRVTDGIICSTDYLARRYRAFNDRTWRCINGIDLKRYQWPKPPKRFPGVTIGWAGGVGHKTSLARWEPALREVLRERPDTRFVSVGHRAADLFVEEFGPERAVAYPAGKIEMYPASMRLFDIAIAPSAENNLFRGKSDLRWLESSALGIPIVAHPETYPAIEEGVTGMHARTAPEAAAALIDLIDHPDKRERIGAAAYEHVSTHRRAEVTAQQWREVLLEVAPVTA